MSSAQPMKRLAILSCMDARFEPLGVLGLSPGDAHVIRNAGGVATEDAIRSLVISQRLLGTEEIAVVHHSDCGMEKFKDEDLKEQLRRETGIRPAFAFEAFANAEDDLHQTVARLLASPFLSARAIRGYIYDVDDTTVRLVVDSERD